MTAKNWILLRSGAAYTFGKDDSALDFEQDVVVPLSRIVRYGGHTTWPWTVAAHAVVCARTAIAAGFSPSTALHALHHDDGEALVGDMVSPLKHQLAEFGPMEDAAQRCIARNAGYTLPEGEYVELVKALDYAALEAERRLLKAPLTPGLTWTVKYDKGLANLAEQLVYRAIINEHAWGPPAAQDYLDTMAELAEQEDA